MNLTSLRKRAFNETVSSLMHDSLEKGLYLDNAEIIRIAVNQEAPSYFVSLAQAEKNINDYLFNGKFTKPMREHRKKLWLSILARLMTCDGIRNRKVYRPKLSYILAHFKAPSYFISENYARKLFYDKSSEF